MPTGSDIMRQAGVLLLDEAHTRWTLPELRDWINDAQRAIVLAKPDANSVTTSQVLASGTLQSLTNADHLIFLRATRNLKSTAPSVGGRAVRMAARDALDTAEPNWHDTSVVPAKKEVRNVIFDEADQRAFYVYPPNDGTGILEIVVGIMPTLLAATGDENDIDSYGQTLDLREPYGVPILDYVLSRAFSKDAEEGAPGRAGILYQQFATALGIKVQVESRVTPNRRAGVVTT